MKIQIFLLTGLIAMLAGKAIADAPFVVHSGGRDWKVEPHEDYLPWSVYLPWDFRGTFPSQSDAIVAAQAYANVHMPGCFATQAVTTRAPGWSIEFNCPAKR